MRKHAYPLYSLSSELLKDSFLPAWWNADETPVNMDCATELNYSHLMGKLNGNIRLIIVVRYNSDRGGTQQKK